MIYVIATLNVKPEMREELLDVARTCITQTRQEPGCISYDLNESVTEPTKFVFVEQWESKEALEAHFKTDHIKTFGNALAGCVTVPLRVEAITPAEVDIL